MAGRNESMCEGALPEWLKGEDPVSARSTVAEPGALMAKPDPQEAFILALHERVMDLEATAAAMERRVPELPPSGFKIAHSERGWVFGVTIWEQGWPESLEGFCKLGEQLLGDISAKAGSLKQWTTLSLCAHDMLDAKRDKIAFCLAFQQAFDDIRPGADHMTVPDRSTAQVPDLRKLVARRITLVEGCIRSSDHRLAPEHIAAGLESVFQAHLLQTDENPEALTAEGRTRPTDLTHATYGTRKVQQVAMPQLWDELVKAAYSKDVYFFKGHAERPEASLPDDEDQPFAFQRTPENVARAAIATVLSDLDEFSGLDHPAIAKILQSIMPST